MKPIIFALSVALGFALGEAIYYAGRTAVARECPPVQQGERLLYSEQGLGATLCAYAAQADGYGRNVKRRRP